MYPQQLPTAPFHAPRKRWSTKRKVLVIGGSAVLAALLIGVPVAVGTHTSHDDSSSSSTNTGTSDVDGSSLNSGDDGLIESASQWVSEYRANGQSSTNATCVAGTVGDGVTDQYCIASVNNMGALLERYNLNDSSVANLKTAADTQWQAWKDFGCYTSSTLTPTCVQQLTIFVQTTNAMTDVLESGSY